MSDDAMRLEWVECRGCGQQQTWFRIEVMEGLEMFGWVHRRIYSGCGRDRDMGWTDKRDME